jgi:hypothetical protein
MLDVGAAENDEVDGPDVERWREQQVAGLDEARQLAFDRGVREAQIDYLFADEAEREGGAQAIADEAAAGAYDMVILSRGYFEDEVAEESSTPEEVAAAVQALDEVRLLVC